MTVAVLIDGADVILVDKKEADHSTKTAVMISYTRSRNNCYIRISSTAPALRLVSAYRTEYFSIVRSSFF